MKQKIMSGMRPTGKLHLGHYLGVIDNWVKLQDEYDCYFSVADWHALTTKYDKTECLRQNTLDVVMDWLACGIAPEKSTIYVQSLVHEIAELNIYLVIITPQNWVERDPTLKDMAKILKTKEGQNQQINYGLMGYPVLMSADIMMFNAVKSRSPCYRFAYNNRLCITCRKQGVFALFQKRCIFVQDGFDIQVLSDIKSQSRKRCMYFLV